MKKLIYTLIILLNCGKSFAQSVTIDPKAATNGSAIIKAQSTNAGTLIPNMTSAQRLAISLPLKGLLVFDTDSATFWFHNGNSWVELVANTSQWTPYNSNTELSSNNYARFNLGNGTNTTGLASGIGTEGTLKINSPSPLTASRYLTLDGNSIQARRINALTDFKTENNLLLNPFGGNVGVGLTSPNAPLQFASTSGVNRKIVLYEEFNNNHQFYGFGINDGILRYQTTGGGDHVFYSATSANTSKELMRVKNDGNVKVSEGIYSNQTGNLNIVPIGISNFKKDFTFSSCIAYSSAIELNNTPSNLTQEETADTEWGLIDDKVWIQLKLNPALASQYSQVVAIGSTNFEGSTNLGFTGSGYINSIISGINRITNIDQYYKTTVIVDDLPCAGSVSIFGSVVFYGIK